MGEKGKGSAEEEKEMIPGSLKALQHMIDLPMAEVSIITSRLLLADKDYPNGTSFAVTSEAPRPGERRLYLSDNSLNRFYAMGAASDGVKEVAE